MEAAVRQADGSSFFQSAESLEKELKQIPGLVAAYEKQADRLAKELQGSEQGRRKPSRIWKKAPGAWYRRRCGGIVRIWMRMERAARR
ncbi:MAG: hypothetical protein ACLR3S_00105 [Clostridium fessum]